MSDVAIRVDGLSKLYRLGAREKYRTLRDSLTDMISAPLRRLRSSNSSNGGAPTMWALKDVSFEVKRGEVVGIIGRNGAGKSTLLKILSRITEPTEGSAEIHGRVGSLLEVGTGFHPELTGRENIYLNGAILGMKKAEIQRKFDEMVAFAEVDRFIDTPVKHYSSGMYVRLAFAVAAHLEPEILIIDEVLAVGDAAFQKKCLGKIGSVAKDGRTVLFVSHNMAAIQQLCGRAVYIDAGELVDEGESRAVVQRYLQEGNSQCREVSWSNADQAPGGNQVRLKGVRLLADGAAADSLVTVETPLDIEFSYWNLVPGKQLNVSFALYNAEDVCVFNVASGPGFRPPEGLIRQTCQIPRDLLNADVYNVRLLIVQDSSTPLLDIERLITFEVHDVPRQGQWYGKWIGAVRPKLDWKTEIDAVEHWSRAKAG